MRRKQIYSSGANIEYRHLAQALIVGWLNGVPGILELDELGQSYRVVPEERFHAIGSGAHDFKLINRVFDALNVDNTLLDRLQLSMELTADGAPYCERPIHIWRVTAKSIEVLS